MALGFYYDSTRCTGCTACQVACKDRLDLQMAGPRPRRVTHYETGSFPEVGLLNMSVSCNHCKKPACVANCPTGAMHQDESGVVLHDDDVCIGCQTCVNSCPYDAPQYVADWNLVVKCDTCKALRDGGMNPVCVDACMMRALEFGDADELRAKHGDALVSELTCLPADETTNPNLMVRVRDGFDAATPFTEILL